MRHGPELLGDGRTRFNLWAPSAEKVELMLGDPIAMERQEEGWWRIETEAVAGTRYRFRINGELLVPDPASRFQPEDVFGPSELIDHSAWRWQEPDWTGRPWTDAVVYELHVGAFSLRGNYDGVIDRLDYLAGLGVTAIELMPLADFPGRRNWGYDGVLPYAPEAAYGRPEDLKRLVDAAHARDLMVMVDVVYNHFGPDGNFLHAYAESFFDEARHTPWGAAINFKRPEVRRFFIDNTLMWLKDYRVDGLRFDAVHAIEGEGVLEELAEEVHRETAGRQVHLVLENADNVAAFLERRQGRPRWYTAQWNDDIHHCFHRALTGEDDGYYGDYDRPVERLARCLEQGFDYQGDLTPSGEPRGEPSGHLPPSAFVACLQNHDQIGNRALGDRLVSLIDVPALRLATMVLLLGPQVPMLFMGEEFACDQPFPFFCDFQGELAEAVREGRRKEFASFSKFGGDVPDPLSDETFQSAVIDWDLTMVEPHREHLAFAHEMLALRQQAVAPLLASGWQESKVVVLDERGIDGVWRFNGGSLRILANFSDRPIEGLAPPSGQRIAELEDSGTALESGRLPAWGGIVVRISP